MPSCWEGGNQGRLRPAATRVTVGDTASPEAGQGSEASCNQGHHRWGSLPPSSAAQRAKAGLTPRALCATLSFVFLLILFVEAQATLEDSVTRCPTNPPGTKPCCRVPIPNIHAHPRRQSTFLCPLETCGRAAETTPCQSCIISHLNPEIFQSLLVLNLKIQIALQKKVTFFWVPNNADQCILMTVLWGRCY